VKLNDHFDQWLRFNQINLAPTTVGWYRSMRRYLEPLMDTELDELTVEQVNELWLDLLSRYAKATVRGAQKTLNVVLKDAEITVKGRQVKVSRTSSAHRGVWTAQQARTFLHFVAKDKYAHAWTIALVCGLRRGELCGLRWDNVDLDEQLIHVREQNTLVNGEGMISGVAPKGDKQRTIPIGPGLTALLAAVPRRGPWVMTSRRHRPLYPTAVSQHWHRLCLRAGVPVIALHDARHTSATVGASVAGVDIKTMQSRLGHADVKILTEVYLHVVTEASRAAAVSMERAFGL